MSEEVLAFAGAASRRQSLRHAGVVPSQRPSKRRSLTLPIGSNMVLTFFWKQDFQKFGKRCILRPHNGNIKIVVDAVMHTALMAEFDAVIF